MGSTHGPLSAWQAAADAEVAAPAIDAVVREAAINNRVGLSDGLENIFINSIYSPFLFFAGEGQTP